MRDILFNISLPFIGKSLPIHGYGVMAMFGFLAALLAARWHARRVKLSPDLATDVCIAALLGGIIGSRIFYVIQNAESFFDTTREGYSFFNIFAIWEGGLVFYGGLFGAMLAVFILLRYRKAQPLDIVDIVAPAVALGMAFGRLGCFLRGCCYGIPLKGKPWYGVQFPSQALPYLDRGAPRPIAPGTTLFPTQIVSAMGWVIIFIILSVYFKRRRHQGEVFGLLLLLYGLHRFGVEFLRGDTHAPGEFSVAQWISIAVFFVGLSIVAYCRNTPALMPSTETTSSSSAPQKGKRRKKNRKKK